VPDYFGAYEDMVVQEYLEFFAAAYNINGPARTKIVNDVLELTDLAYKRDAPVDGLSRGMKQRLSIARVLSTTQAAPARRAGRQPRSACAHRDARAAQGAAPDG
jgi:ABC-type multidrug transport system ATPase subunit